MIGFGEQLRRAREEKGLSLDAVADATRVARHHLEALERGDLRALPAGPFARGYIEACAKVLDVDPTPILLAWRAEAQRQHLDAGEARDRTIEEMSQIVGRRAEPGAHPGGVSFGGKTVALALAALVFAAIVVVVLLRGRTPVGHPPASTPPTEVSPPGVASGVGSSPPAVSGEPTDGAAAVAPAPAAPAARATPTPSPSPQPNPDLRVADFGVGTGVASHRLVGRGERFAEESEVVFWTLVVGGRPGDAIRHVWFESGRAVMRADLDVGSAYWRTYSRLTLPRGAIGEWAVEARDPWGRLLARQEFSCVSAER